MPYRMTRPAGPWLAGAVVDDKDFNDHAFHEKFLRTGAAKLLKKGDDTSARSAQQQAEINEVDARLAELTARRAELTAQTDATEPNAPGNVAFDLPVIGEPPKPNQDDIKAAGNEVIQPTAAGPNVGEVVPTADQGAPADDTGNTDSNAASTSNDKKGKQS